MEPGEGALDDVADLAQAYDAYYAGLSEQFAARLAQITSPDADPAEAAAVIVRVVDASKGQRPFRVRIDPADDGAETVVNRVGDLVRTAFYQRIGLDDLLSPR